MGSRRLTPEEEAAARLPAPSKYWRAQKQLARLTANLLRKHKVVRTGDLPDEARIELAEALQDVLDEFPSVRAYLLRRLH